MRFKVDNPNPQGQLAAVIPTMMQLQRAHQIHIRGISTETSGQQGYTEITATLTFNVNSMEALDTLLNSFRQ